MSTFELWDDPSDTWDNPTDRWDYVSPAPTVYQVPPTIANPLTFLAYDMISGNLLAEVPFSGGTTFSSRLNTPGSFSGKLDFLDPRVQAIGLPEALLEGRTLIFVDYLGYLIWGGVVWTSQFSRETATAVPIGGMELWSYFVHRMQATDYSTVWSSTPVDPITIAYQVTHDALQSTGSGFGPSTGFPLSINQNNGVPTPSEFWITASYPISQLQTIDTIVSQLAQLGYYSRFDFGIDVAYNAEHHPEITLNIDNPRRGEVASLTSVVFETQEDRDYGYPKDATQTANTVYESGSTTSQAPLQTTLGNPNPISQGWPLLEMLNRGRAPCRRAPSRCSGTRRRTSTTSGTTSGGSLTQTRGSPTGSTRTGGSSGPTTPTTTRATPLSN
jgi:hypothetical protein